MKNYIYEKLTFSEVNSVLAKCSICVIGLSEYNQPYMIPMYFEYDITHNEPRFILESKDTGQKMRILNNNDKVSIFIQYNESSAYKTIIATGKAFICEYEEDTNYKNLVKIKVQIKDITGRVYYK